MKMKTDSECKFCKEDETAEHVMCNCEVYTQLRQEYTGKSICNLDDFAKLNVDDFIKFSKRIMRRMWTPSNG